MAESPKECAAGSDVVITMVADADAFFDVAEGPDGLLAGIRKKARSIDMSTVGRAAAKRASELRERREHGSPTHP